MRRYTWLSLATFNLNTLQPEQFPGLPAHWASDGIINTFGNKHYPSTSIFLAFVHLGKAIGWER